MKKRAALIICLLLLTAGRCDKPDLDPSSSDFCQATEKALKKAKFDFRIRTVEQVEVMTPEFLEWFLVMKKTFEDRCPKEYAGVREQN